MRTLAVCAVLGASHARADELASSPVRAGYEPRQARILDGAWREDLETRGLRWNATYAGELFAAPELDDSVVAAGLFALEVDVDLGTLAGAPLGALRATALAIHGHGLVDELMNIHNVSGNVAEPDVRLFEVWYEQPIGAFTLRGGLLAADQEYVAAEHSASLLGATFGITSQFSANQVGPEYPVATPGVSGRLELAPIAVRGAMYDGTRLNTHGIPTALGPERLVIGEVQLASSLTLGAWHHTTRGSAYYAVIDAALADGLGAFARAGISPDGFVDTYIDAGARLVAVPRRPDDAISVGLAFAGADTGVETVVEASYEAQLRWLTLQPDVQVLFLRGRTILALATRVTLAF